MTVCNVILSYAAFYVYLLNMYSSQLILLPEGEGLKTNIGSKLLQRIQWNFLNVVSLKK